MIDKRYNKIYNRLGIGKWTGQHFCPVKLCRTHRCGKEDKGNYMNFLNKMERKFGRYAIYNLSTYIIGAYIIGYFLYFLAPGVLYNHLSLEPYYILKGQIWRLVTWF